jgi:hypothetical protein
MTVSDYLTGLALLLEGGLKQVGPPEVLEEIAPKLALEVRNYAFLALNMEAQAQPAAEPAPDPDVLVVSAAPPPKKQKK